MAVVDLDILEKRRLASRRFGFVRHHVYRTKTLIEPPRDSVHYVPEEDRLDKDFDSSLRAENENRKAKEKEARVIKAARQAYREQQLYVEREKEWEKKIERDSFLRTKPHAPNKSGTAYNFITMEYHDGYEGQKLKYLEDCARWRDGLRRLRLQSKMSGTRNYNVITWQKATPLQLPARPDNLSPGSTSTSRPCTAPTPEPPKLPIKAVEASRPMSATVEKGVNAAENYHWDLDDYRQRPYVFK